MTGTKKKWFKRKPAHKRSDLGVESKVIGVCEDRVLIQARWKSERNQAPKTNLTVVSRAYWTERYGLTPEEAM